MPSRELILMAVICISSATGALAGPVEEAMEADRAFSRLAQEKGVAEAFAAFVAPDGIRFVPGGQQRGPETIKASMSKDFADGSKLAWAPIEGTASADGSQVVTYGRWSYTAAGAREPGRRMGRGSGAMTLAMRIRVPNPNLQRLFLRIIPG